MKRGVFDVFTEQEHAFGNLPKQLEELKDCRRDAKHRGQTIDPETANRLAWASAFCAQVLLAAIRRQDSEFSGGF